MSQIPNILNDDGFLDPESLDQKYLPLDNNLNTPINKSLISEQEGIEQSFLQTNLYEIQNKETKKLEDYNSSNYRIQKYKEVVEKDQEFNKYLKGLYGSSDTYFQMNRDLIENKIFNPLTDFQAQVEIVTADTFYKSNFISQNETVLELLGGICTIEFIKIDGRIDRIVASLSQNFLPQSQVQTRNFAFGGLPGSRVLVWNMLKQKWASFYMSRLQRFIRDDTSGIQ